MKRSRWHASTAWFCLWLCAVCSIPGVAAAAEPEPEPGRDLFELGVRAYKDGRYGAAIAAFQEAYRLTQRQGLLFSLAQAFRRAHESEGKPEDLREAIRYYTRYLAVPGGDRRKEAESQLVELKRLPGAKGWEAVSEASARRTQLVISVNVASARLTLDGRQVPVLPHAAEVLPGAHQVEVSADGYEPFRREVQVPINSVVPLHVVLRRSSGTLEVSGNEGAELFVDGESAGRLPLSNLNPSAGEHEIELRQAGHITLRQRVRIASTGSVRLDLQSATTLRRKASWSAVGVGAPAIVVGGVLGYLAFEKQDQAKELQKVPGALEQFKAAISARDRLRTSAAIVGGLGVVGLVGGLVSLATEGPGPVLRLPQQASAHELRLSASLSHVSVSLSF